MVPQFETISELLAMGGHGLYVWLSYGSTVLVLAGSYFSLRFARQRQLEELRWQASTNTSDQQQMAHSPKSSNGV